MAFQFFLKKLKFPNFLLNYSENSNIQQRDWKFTPLHWKMLLKIWEISLLTWVAPKTQKFEFLAREKAQQILLCCSFLFSNMSGKWELCASKLIWFEIFWKIMIIDRRNVILNRRDISAVQSCFRKNQRCLALILLLWKLDFSTLIRVESMLFRDFQVMYSSESVLKQRWSALIIFELEVIRAEVLWDRNPGYNLVFSKQIFREKQATWIFFKHTFAGTILHKSGIRNNSRCFFQEWMYGRKLDPRLLAATYSMKCHKKFPQNLYK